MVVRLPHIQGSSGVIISGSPQVTLSLVEGALSHSQSMARIGAEEARKKEEEEVGRLSQDPLCSGEPWAKH
ncbi:hypothetical protein CesoFtcFv8_004925 [Champsocephalus esox]|uniref:Uncharacterized protein n=1 Tax=Champsocephalus esox TaxID=159716 RepID=A0AAN8CRN9_9TELE|nr:hypothetical protein CesoFtcFv8_004925 [Champsocephalus esox]